MSPPREVTEHDRRRLRQAWLVLLIGLAVAVVLTVAAGLSGLPGAVGALALLVTSALAVAITGVHLLGFVLVDDLRDHPVARRRPVIAAGLLLLAGLLMAMATGVAAG
jgi:heme/copper-type cytochrome/quinol oxidase subunit 4